MESVAKAGIGEEYSDGEGRRCERESEARKKPPATGSQGSDRRRRRGRLAWKGSLFSKKKNRQIFGPSLEKWAETLLGQLGGLSDPKK